MNSQFSVQFIFAGTFVLGLFAFFLIAILIVQKNKQNKFRSEMAVQTFKHQNQILQVRLHAQEETMDQLSREIHDNLNQLMGLMQVNLYMLIDRVTDPEDKNSLKRISDLVGQVTGDLQNMSHSLNGTFISNLGLEEALAGEVEYLNMAQKLLCTFTVNGDTEPLSAEKELLAFRIAQEAIHNILKHSGATKMDITLTYNTPKIMLSITDNGVGFNSAAHEGSGIGMINMMQRAQSLQGALDVRSTPGSGTEILLTIENDNTNE